MKVLHVIAIAAAVFVLFAYVVPKTPLKDKADELERSIFIAGIL